MGNRLEKSKLDVSHIFDGRTVPNPENKCVKLNITIPKPVFGIDKFQLHCRQKQVSVHRCSDVENTTQTCQQCISSIDWNPCSNMIDFYTPIRYKSEGLTLKKGQIVGIVIIECIHLRIIIYYDDKEGIALDCCKWELTDNGAQCLNNDLVLGLHILYLKGENAQEIIELMEPDLPPPASDGKVYKPKSDNYLDLYVHPSWSNNIYS